MFESIEFMINLFHIIYQLINYMQMGNVSLKAETAQKLGGSKTAKEEAL